MRLRIEIMNLKSLKAENRKVLAAIRRADRIIAALEKR
jgi:hypothetical protein